MFTFEPMSEEELSSYGTIDYGFYEFEVIKSEKRISKSGNPMAELQIQVWDKEGKPHYIYDYLVFSKVPLNIRKVKHFCDTVGLAEEYKKGLLPENMERLSGKVEIGIQSEMPKPDGGYYPKKNIVLDYFGQKEKNKKDDGQKSNDFLSDDIPF